MSLAAHLSNNGKQKIKINVSQIRENPLNFYEKEDVYKRTIDKETGQDIELVSLAEGIKEKGQMHNIVVYADNTLNDGKEYTLISGARRYKAILFNFQNGESDGSVDALIIDKPQNAYEESMLIMEGNKQRRREFTSKKVAYQEVLTMEQIYDEYKKQGLIPKGQVDKRKYVSMQLGIAEGTIHNLHQEFDKTNENLTPKQKAKVNKNERKKRKYNEVAEEIQSEVSSACSKVKLSDKELVFKYDCFEDLEHLLEILNLQDVYLDDLKEWATKNV